MFNVICKIQCITLKGYPIDPDDKLTVYAVQGNTFLVFAGENFEWVNMKHFVPPGSPLECSHGYVNWDNCPVCGH